MGNKYSGQSTSGEIVGIPSAVLKVHTSELIIEAAPVMRFDQFAVVKDDLTKEPGDTILFSKLANLPRGGALREDQDIESKSKSRTTVPITVTEYGNSTGITGKLEALSFMDEMSDATMLLARDYAKVTDLMLRDAVCSGTQTYYCGNKTAQKNITSAETITLPDLDQVVEILATNNTEKMADANGEYLVGFFHPHQITAISQKLLSIKQYAYPEMIFKGEVGSYNSIRFISTTHMPNGAAQSDIDPETGDYIDAAYDPTLVDEYEYASGEANAVNLYKGVVFGARAYGWAVALPVELREDPGQASFGRKRRLAWYAIQGAGKIVDENIVVIISA